MLLESPIILIMSASTALVHDRLSLHMLRRFTYALNLGITLAMGLLVFTPAFGWLMEGLIGLPHEVAALTHDAAIILLPWPAAIGYRRFYQGILIRSGLTRRVAYGTVVRLSSMGTVALVAAFTPGVEGAVAGASALSAGVVMEALASRVMALGCRPQTPANGAASGGTREEPMTYGYIWRFYYPLALTSILTLGVNPVVTFFLGQSRMALESLAAMPVVNSLVFLFGSVGFAFQEVGIALIGARARGIPPPPALRRDHGRVGFGRARPRGLLPGTAASGWKASRGLLPIWRRWRRFPSASSPSCRPWPSSSLSRGRFSWRPRRRFPSPGQRSSR